MTLGNVHACLQGTKHLSEPVLILGLFGACSPARFQRAASEEQLGCSSQLG